MKKVSALFLPILFWLLVLTQFISLLALSYRFDEGIRIVNYSFFGVGLLFLVFSLIDQKDSFKRFLPVLVILIISIVSWILYGCNFETIISFLAYFLMLSVWVVSDGLVKFIKFRKIIIISTVLQGILLITFSFSSRAYLSYQEYVSVSRELTLGFSNPNTTGIILFSTISLLIISFKDLKSFITKTFVILEILYLSFLLFKTDARTSIFGLVIILVWCAFFKKMRVKKLSRLNCLTILILTASFMFVFFYLWIGNQGNLTNVMLFGKKMISGRQRVYSDAFSNWNNILFGNMNFFHFGNVHNGLLTILVNTGIIGFFFYIFLVLREFFYINKRNYLIRHIPIGFVVLITLFLISTTEGAILVGGTIFYYYQLIVLSLCRLETKVSIK